MSRTVFRMPSRSQRRLDVITRFAKAERPPDSAQLPAERDVLHQGNRRKSSQALENRSDRTNIP